MRVRDVPDSYGALNGLQVQNSGSVGSVLAAVDASQASIDAAVEGQVDLLLVHHGLFWGDAKPIVGSNWRRLKALIEHDIAVYAAHIPLDCHEEVGNNIVLARTLSLQNIRPFGDYKGIPMGVLGSIDVALDDLAALVARELDTSPHVIRGGPKRVHCVGVVTGGGGNFVADARRAGVDTFLTGEATHHTHFEATEGGINVLLAGHYATEVFGVKALAAHLHDRFRIPWTFFDHPTGL